MLTHTAFIKTDSFDTSALWEFESLSPKSLALFSLPAEALVQNRILSYTNWHLVLLVWQRLFELIAWKRLLSLSQRQPWLEAVNCTSYCKTDMPDWLHCKHFALLFVKSEITLCAVATALLMLGWADLLCSVTCFTFTSHGQQFDFL